jgi:putative RecB family exonuclease
MDAALKLPEKLSPSRVKDFMQCPKLFYFKSMLKLSSPPTEATARGTVAHYAFEFIFNHPQGERTPDAAVAYVRPAWEMMLYPFRDRALVVAGSPEEELRNAEGAYADACEEGSSEFRRKAATAESYLKLVADGEIETEAFLAGTEAVVRAWYGMENPNKFEPADREKYVFAQTAGALVHGFIDRVDAVTGPGGERVYVSDYKTGKMPRPQYEDDAFFQLEVYALLMKLMDGVDVYQLRLVYVKEGRPDAVLTRLVTPAILKKTEAKLGSVWKAIKRAHATGVWDTKQQVLCGWCYFKPVCPAFHPELDGMLPEEAAARAS